MDGAEEFDLHGVVYSKDVLEMVTVASEFCGYMEIAEGQSSTDFVNKTLKILSLLYLKASFVTKPKPLYDEGVEAFVTEEEYHMIRNAVATVIGSGDDYLEVFHPDIQYSDGPIRATISEDLADIYQYLKNFTTLFGMGTEELMNDGLAECMDAFGEHWGQKLVNVMRALHQLKFENSDAEDWEDSAEDQPKERDDFYTRMQKEWRDEE